MTKRKRLTVVITVCVALSLLGLSFLHVLYGVHQWREKMTVTLQTPEGAIVSETIRAVRFVTNRLGTRWGAPAGMRVRGEAVVFDLGAEGALFVLVGDDEHNLFRGLRDEGVSPKSIRWQLWRPWLEQTVQTEDYPAFAYFPDVNEPTSVRRVTRQSIPNILSREYGIESITISRSYGALTTGKVAAVIPWINDKTLIEDPRWRLLRNENGFLSDAVMGLMPGRLGQ